MTDTIKVSPFRVLLGGFINLNVIDGSAFFLSGLCGMLAGQPHVETTLISANPIRKMEVIQEILHFPNVKIIDPYEPAHQQQHHLTLAGSSMSRKDYASVLAKIYCSDQFDAILVRDTETCYHLATQHPELAPQLSVYVTGVTSLDKVPEEDVLTQLRSIIHSGARLVAQTQAMAEKIAALKIGVSVSEIFILPPHVSDADESFETLYHRAKSPSRLVYTGKFFEAWNADKILASFKSSKAQLNPELTLEIAGDQFRHSPTNPHFVDNVKYLLSSTPGLKWHGRQPRFNSRRIIRRSHVGIGWRSSELDSSAELSTKILEYGSMGIPSILNRNALHEELLGEDYPLFANSTTEFKSLLGRLGSLGAEVEEAARRCYELSSAHWYSSVRKSLLNHLGNNLEKHTSSEIVIPLGSNMTNAIKQSAPTSTVQAEIDGAVLRLQRDPSSQLTVRAAVTEAQFRFDSWTHVMNASMVLVNDATALLSEPDAVNSTEPSIADSLRDAEQRARKYHDELTKLREKISPIRNILNRVNRSPLGPVYRKAKTIYRKTIN